MTRGVWSRNRKALSTIPVVKPNHFGQGAMRSVDILGELVRDRHRVFFGFVLPELELTFDPSNQDFESENVIQSPGNPGMVNIGYLPAVWKAGLHSFRQYSKPALKFSVCLQPDISITMHRCVVIR